MKYDKIQQSLLKWFKNNRRDLPWRKNRTWYNVWISEIMLQQTQVEQVKNYFQDFIAKFPSIKELANADLQLVLKTWEGMGYYSRARNLHKTAQIIVNKYNREFPDDKSQIIKLPGIGEYTTNALMSFVYNKPYSVVDGNVIRVISRIFGIIDNIRESQTVKTIKSKTNLLLPPNNSANYNESVMELGALLCLPKNPKCESCPVKMYCTAFKKGLTDIIPFKTKNALKPKILSIVQILRKDDRYLIVKRKDEGLLGGYWEFPFKKINNEKELKEYTEILTLKPIKHSYTHFNLLMYPVLMKENLLFVNNNLYVENKWIKYDKIREVPVHKAMQKVLVAISNL